MATEHRTVLLKEAVEALIVDVNGFYIDGTFGRGGHTAELLSCLSKKAVVWAIDKDPQAITEGQVQFQKDERLKFVHGSFADLTNRRHDPPVPHNLNLFNLICNTLDFVSNFG